MSLLVSCLSNNDSLNFKKEKIFIKNNNFNKVIDFTNLQTSYLENPAIIINEVNSALFFANCEFNDSIIAFKQGTENVKIVKFTRPVSFYNCTFDKPINFRQAYFNDNVYFIKCVFKDDVHFEGATFNCSKIDFRETHFKKIAKFTSSKFKGEVNFTNCVFDSTAKFNDCSFYQKANFTVIKFDEKTDFSAITSFEAIKFNYSFFTDKFILSGIKAKDDVELVGIKTFTNFNCKKNKIFGNLILHNAEIQGDYNVSDNICMNLDTTGLKINYNKGKIGDNKLILK